MHSTSSPSKRKLETMLAPSKQADAAPTPAALPVGATASGASAAEPAAGASPNSAPLAPHAPPPPLRVPGCAAASVRPSLAWWRTAVGRGGPSARAEPSRANSSRSARVMAPQTTTTTSPTPARLRTAAAAAHLLFRGPWPRQAGRGTRSTSTSTSSKTSWPRAPSRATGPVRFALARAARRACCEPSQSQGYRSSGSRVPRPTRSQYMHTRTHTHAHTHTHTTRVGTTDARPRRSPRRPPRRPP